MSPKRRETESTWKRLSHVVTSSLFGREIDEETREHLQEIKGLFLVGFSLWLFVAMASFRAPLVDPGTVGMNWAGGLG